VRLQVTGTERNHVDVEPPAHGKRTDRSIDMVAIAAGQQANRPLRLRHRPDTQDCPVVYERLSDNELAV